MKTLPQVLLLDEAEIPSLSPSDSGLGALRTERGLLPLEAVEVAATLEGLTAHLSLSQTFVNVHDQVLEATYIFPLPERAAVVRFQLQVGDRLIEGVLKERGQARREYREAIAQGHQAAITEEERPGTFTMRVGNIPSGERATVHLELAQPLPFVDGEATFRFPLVVAPRYIPGVPLNRPPVGSGISPDTDAVPDASRISPPVLLPGFPNPVALSLRVLFLESSLRPLSVRSSLHTVIDEETSAGLSLRLLAGERLNRDFILRFRLAERTIRTGLALHPDAEGNGGTFALTLFPPDLTDQPQRPRDIVFVLDRSGSMSGWKMVTARRAVMRLVESLNEADRFAVYAFDNRIDTPPAFDGDRLMRATFTNRTVALDFLQQVNDRGGTEMAGPLDLALSRLLESGSESTRDRVLVLITDGQVGNEAQMLRRFGERLKHVRVHALGIDRAVNAGFLQQLADLGGGSSVLVESEERLEEVIDSVQRTIGTAVLTHLSLSARGIDIEDGSVVPARLPDLFVGSPLVIQGRYRGGSEGAMELIGSAADGVRWTATVPATPGRHPALPALWARQRLRDLEDRYTITPAKALEKEIVEVSLRYGVMCRFTSYVAVDRSRVVNAGGQQHRVTQAVELPEGWSENRRFDAAPQAASAPEEMLARCLPCASPVIRDEDADRECDAIEAGPRKRVSRKAAPGNRSEARSRRMRPRQDESVTMGPGESGLFGSLAQIAGAVVDGIRRLFGMGREASANPLDRSQFIPRVDAMLGVIRGATTTVTRQALLPEILRQLYQFIREVIAAGDLSTEVQRLGLAIETLSQVAGAQPVDETGLNAAWMETLAALEAYRTLCDPDGFWK